MLLSTVGAALNMLFSMRAPQLIITSLVAQLVSYPLGLAWARYMPSRRFRVFGKDFSLNPGPFGIKEHTLIVVMANVAFSGGQAYSTDVCRPIPLHRALLNQQCRRSSLRGRSTAKIGVGAGSCCLPCRPSLWVTVLPV